jgi:DNA-binding NarL/FixJ family response regulator
VRVAALVDDLLDRSRIAAALPDAAVCRDRTAVAAADVIIVDLARHAADVAPLRATWPDARIVAYGAHVDHAALAAARTDGADEVLPRSRFFQDPAAAVASPSDAMPPSDDGGEG